MLFDRSTRLAACLAAGLLSFSLVGCKQQTVEVPELLDPVGNKEQSFTVVKTDMVAYHTDSNVKIAANAAAVRFESGGTVGNFEVSVGEMVKKGQLLAVLEDIGLHEQYEQVLSRIDVLKTNHTYYAQMLQCDVKIAKLQLQSADQAGIEQAKLTLKEAELALAHCIEQYEHDLKNLQKERDGYLSRMEHNKLYAPMDGVVSYLPDTSKARVYLTENDTAAIITDQSTLTVEMDYITDAKAYDTYTHYTAMVNGKEYPLTLDQPTAEEYAATVKSGMPAYTSFTFTDGVPAEVTTASVVTVYLYYYEAKDVFAVAYHALQHDGSTYSLDIERDGRRFVQPVKVGQVTATHAIILEGLKEGDIVYV